MHLEGDQNKQSRGLKTTFYRQGGRRGDKPLVPPSYMCRPCYICLHFPYTDILHSTLHCIVELRLRKEIRYILIHQIPFKALRSSIALKIHVCHFKNCLFLFVVKGSVREK